MQFCAGLGRETEETALDIESSPVPLVDERWRSFRRQKAESFSRARRGRTGSGSQPFTRHHVVKPADPFEVDCIGRVLAIKTARGRARVRAHNRLPSLEGDETSTHGFLLSVPPLRQSSLITARARNRPRPRHIIKILIRTGTYASPRAAATPTRSTTSPRPSRAGPARPSTRRPPPGSSSAPRKGATRARRRTSRT